MNELRCKIVVDGAQCSSVLRTPEPVSADVSYICAKHPDSVQRAAAGNVVARRPNVHFQEPQFDKDLSIARRPQGTSHIHRQGKAHDSDKQETFAKVREIR